MVAKYHMTPNGPKLCSAQVKDCPYKDAGHFDSREDAYRLADSQEAVYHRKVASADKFYAIAGADAEALLESEHWGAKVMDLIEARRDTTAGGAKHIDLELEWTEPSPDGDPAKSVKYFMNTVSRFDNDLQAFTNIYRLTWAEAGDAEALKKIDFIKRYKNSNNASWEEIPEELKWEGALGLTGEAFDARFLKETKTVVSETNGYQQDAVKQKLAEGYRLDKQGILGKIILGEQEALDEERLIKVLTNVDHVRAAERASAGNAYTIAMDPLSPPNVYKRKVAKKARNIIEAIKAIETHHVGPLAMAERGYGFYELDEENRPYIEEDLSSTSLRYEHVANLNAESRRWFADRRVIEKEPTRIKRFERLDAIGSAANKPVMLSVPATFWTSNTPDGTRWELTINTHSDSLGKHRVRHFNPNKPHEAIVDFIPSNSIDGSQMMREAMEHRYGDFSTWSPELRREMKVLDDLSHAFKEDPIEDRFYNDNVAYAFQADEKSAKVAEYYRLEKAGDTVGAENFFRENSVAAEQRKAKNEHNSLFGSLKNLFG